MRIDLDQNPISSDAAARLAARAKEGRATPALGVKATLTPPCIFP